MAIKVEVCMGTTCFVMGSSGLQVAIEEMVAQAGKEVEFVPRPCLGLCEDNRYGKSPYVKVDGEVIADASPEKIMAAINR